VFPGPAPVVKLEARVVKKLIGDDARVEAWKVIGVLDSDNLFLAVGSRYHDYHNTNIPEPYLPTATPDNKRLFNLIYVLKLVLIISKIIIRSSIHDNRALEIVFSRSSRGR